MFTFVFICRLLAGNIKQNRFQLKVDEKFTHWSRKLLPFWCISQRYYVSISKALCFFHEVSYKFVQDLPKLVYEMWMSLLYHLTLCCSHTFDDILSIDGTTATFKEP